MNQESLFDQELGEELRDRGLERAGNAGEPGDPWRAWAWTELEAMAAEGGDFNADDLEERRVAAGKPAPPSPHAVGALFSAASRAELIVPTGRMRTMRRPGAHARRTFLWTGARRPA